MNLYDVMLIAVALSMDAGAITISNCSVYKKSLNAKKQWAMPIFFAVFQGIMPLIGFFLGSLLTFIQGDFAGYLSSAIFFILSAKIFIDIIKDAKGEKEGTLETDNQPKTQNLTFLVLLLQGIATSIDALVIGITFIELTIPIAIAVLVIAVITFIIVGLCVIFGKKLGNVFGKYADFVGAFILLGLAIKSLVQIFI